MINGCCQKEEFVPFSFSPLVIFILSLPPFFPFLLSPLLLLPPSRPRPPSTLSSSHPLPQRHLSPCCCSYLYATLLAHRFFPHCWLLAASSVAQAQHLLNAADCYGLLRLRGLCERFLARALAADNAAFTLTLADQHSAPGLRAAALRFIAGNVAAVVATEGWRHLVAARPALVEECLLVASAGGGGRG